MLTAKSKALREELRVALNLAQFMEERGQPTASRVAMDMALDLTRKIMEAERPTEGGNDA